MAALILLLLMRIGFLAIAVGFFVAVDLFILFSVTYETSSWYSPYSFAALAIFAAIVLYAFRTSLGGRPAFGTPRLDD